MRTHTPRHSMDTAIDDREEDVVAEDSGGDESDGDAGIGRPFNVRACTSVLRVLVV